MWATAHVRGGGEYGREWHEGGRLLTKSNTWGDMIAAAEALIAEKWTSPSKLAIRGGSAGGITVGRAMTERPDLFASVISQVGVSNSLRAEFSQNGPPNVPEFGSVKTADGFKGLYAMDSYVHVKDGVKYPAVMLTTGMTDPRVDPWQAGKMAARLQKASASGKPVSAARRLSGRARRRLDAPAARRGIRRHLRVLPLAGGRWGIPARFGIGNRARRLQDPQVLATPAARCCSMPAQSGARSWLSAWLPCCSGALAGAVLWAAIAWLRSPTEASADPDRDRALYPGRLCRLREP